MKTVLCFLAIIVGVVFGGDDAAFAACCKDKNVAETCQPICNYGSTPEEVGKAFADGRCNAETDGSPFYQCLENQKDNTECCIADGVGADASLDFCIDACDGSKPHTYDPKYNACSVYAQAIFDCGKNA
uniref:Domain of unknown function DB domain-containing protein n=1 Tax=Panagrolaimus davidi TaxID=227884 RepID=A0A914PWC8_9BILA